MRQMLGGSTIVQCGIHYATIKKREQQGVQREVQRNRLFVKKYKTKKEMDRPRLDSVSNGQSQLIC